MKKILVVVVVVAMALVGANVAMAAVAGSKHDLSDTTTGGTGTWFTGGTLSACQYCHTPHRANTAVTGAPLWNRADNSSTTYTPYTSNTMTVVVSLGANSYTCLSCHDGATAVGNTFASGSTSDLVEVVASDSFDATTDKVAGNANIGTSLADDHPVGILYLQGVAGLDSPANATNTGLKLYGATGSEKVECGSCHDPHNAANGYFLRVSRSSICTKCHSAK